MNPRESTATYKTWRDQVKGYITAFAWNSACQTGEQLDSVQNFACSHPPVNHQVTKIKSDHRREVVEEVLRPIRVLVKATPKKLQATNDRLHTERPDDTAQRPDNTTAEMASDIMSKFEYPTSLRSVCVTVIIICF